MDQIDRKIEFEADDLTDVRKLLRPDGTLNEADIARRCWTICEIDDKALFGEDAHRLARAFRREHASVFYVIPVLDILVPTKTTAAYRFEATFAEIEAFQGPEWFFLNLDDCLMFNFPMTCAVLRPGHVDHTKFAGSPAFVAEIT